MKQWSNLRVKDIVVKIGNGVTPKGGSNVYIDKGIPFLRSQNIHYNGLKLDNVSYISQDLSDLMSFSKLKPFDILINITGASIGRTCIVPDDFERGNISQHVAFLRLKNNLDKYFISYVLKANKTFEHIMLEQLGASKEAFNLGQIARIPISLPLSILEQTKIANYLDTKTQKIDNEISLLEQKIKKYQELKQTLINESVLRGLNKDVELKDSGIQWIGDIPKHWDMTRYKDSFLILSSGIKYFDDYKSYLSTKSVGVNEIIQVEDEITFSDRPSRANMQPLKNTAWFAKMRFTNKCLIFKDEKYKNYILSTGFAGIKVKDDDIDFIKYYLMSSYFKFEKNMYSYGTTQESINDTNIAIINFVKPPYEEQIQIANYLDEKTTRVDEIVKTLSTKIEVLKEFRKTLINDVVTGKVKVA